jgi:hypothetical protein
MILQVVGGESRGALSEAAVEGIFACNSVMAIQYTKLVRK